MSPRHKTQLTCLSMKLPKSFAFGFLSIVANLMSVGHASKLDFAARHVTSVIGDSPETRCTHIDCGSSARFEECNILMVMPRKC